MKRNRTSKEIASLNRAAFHVGANEINNGFLDELLARVVGGQIDITTSTCTDFTCNLYAPPPPSEN